MKKKQMLIGFYRTIGTGAAMLLGLIVLAIVTVILGGSIDFAGIQIN